MSYNILSYNVNIFIFYIQEVLYNNNILRSKKNYFRFSDEQTITFHLINDIYPFDLSYNCT